MNLSEQYVKVRNHTESICKPLQIEDYVVQPVVDVSPPKWHLGHTTWFFETFILQLHASNYQVFDQDYNFVFNSYYETVGKRVIRTDRGNLSRPSVQDVYKYRKYVDDAMSEFLKHQIADDVYPLVVLGLNHEQQHQELLITDIKFILGNNPLFPIYDRGFQEHRYQNSNQEYLNFKEGIYEVGYEGDDFCFDNELNRHKVYLHDFSISAQLVSNQEYMQFVADGGYQNFNFWHAEGWDWVQQNKIEAPMYWHNIDGSWHNYTMAGLQPVELDAPVTTSVITRPTLTQVGKA